MHYNQCQLSTCSQQRLLVIDLFASLFISSCLFLLEYFPFPRESEAVENIEPHNMPIPIVFLTSGRSTEKVYLSLSEEMFDVCFRSMSCRQ